jgi:purine-binding chemotaxis protein CheW
MTSKSEDGRAAAAAEADAGGGQYLTFQSAGEAFGVAIAVVKEIIQFGAVTQVPLVPAFIRGVINLRGAVVPVIDLNLRFGRGESTPGKKTCIVIVETEQDGGLQDIGIMVDAVSAVVDIPDVDMAPPPRFGAGVRADFIRKVGKVGGRFVMIIDVPRALSVETLAGLDLVAAAEAA